jgi:hypothetical protein
MPWIPCQKDWENREFLRTCPKMRREVMRALLYFVRTLLSDAFFVIVSKLVVVRLEDSIMRIPKHLLFIIIIIFFFKDRTVHGNVFQRFLYNTLKA